MKGFFSEALVINVTDRTSTIKHLDEPLLRSSLGGKGLGAKLLLEYNRPGVDPLGPETTSSSPQAPLQDQLCTVPADTGFSPNPH